MPHTWWSHLAESGNILSRSIMCCALQVTLKAKGVFFSRNFLFPPTWGYLANVILILLTR